MEYYNSNPNLLYYMSSVKPGLRTVDHSRLRIVYHNDNETRLVKCV